VTEDPIQLAREEVSNPASATLGTNTEMIHHLVDDLTEKYLSTPQPPSPSAINNRTPLTGSSLEVYADWLKKAHQVFRDSTNQELTLTYASEWVLDNDYIIIQALRQIKEDLPSGYYARLPRLAQGPSQGLPRIYAILVDILTHQRLLVNLSELQVILIRLQEQIPLTMGELWAAPIFLRYGLIEALSHALAELLPEEAPASFPTRGPELPHNISAEDSQAPSAESSAGGAIASAILSFRAISEQNWNDFFEAVSTVEQILRRDPAGIYPAMDFKSRDLYRKEIERLANGSDQNEEQLAVLALELAEQAAHSNGHLSPRVDRHTHVGEYLLGPSVGMLETRAHYQPDRAEKLTRWAYRHSTGVYLGSQILIILALLGVAAWAWERISTLAATPLSGLILILGLLIIPALTLASSLANHLITLLLPPRVLPKMEFRRGIPDLYQTLVAIPALLTSPEEIDDLCRQMEQHYLRNSEDGLRFALLTDYPDAQEETLPNDADLFSKASAAVQALNERYPLPEDRSRFFLLHRPRRWNPAEGRWMGWERKRGKLHQMNRLLLGEPGAETAFHHLSEDWTQLQGMALVITLDADTILPQGAARRLVGALAHPLNQAVFDAISGRVTSGYTILQPRMEIGPSSTSISWFTRIFAGDAGLDLYTLAVSDAYMDLFGEGIYVGKGIYDVAAFERSVGDCIPENSVLSHDLLEGLLGRAGLISDVTLVEDYPPNFFAQTMRQRRWMRGDWQLLPWLVRPSALNARFSIIDQWKMGDNLRRSMLAPCLLAVFVLGMLFLPEMAWFWLVVTLFTPAGPFIMSLGHSARLRLEGSTTETAFRPAGWDAIRWLLAVTFLPYEAYLALDSIFTTLYRLLVSRRNLLQWTTAAQTARLFGDPNQRETAWQKLGVSSLLATLLGGLVAILYGLAIPSPFWIALPVLALWFASPWVMRWLNQPILKPVEPLKPEQILMLRRVARRTWSFFERYVGPEDHWLPPDHYQEAPVGIIAHQTSPTNIGLLFTSTLAAYDFGYLDPLSLASRLKATMDSLEHLDRPRGHFLNWYDTLTMQPLTPRYISTVDSGNLAAGLIITAQACRDLPNQRIFRWELWQGYLDSLDLLVETLGSLYKAEFTRTTGEIDRRIAQMQDRIQAARNSSASWYSLYREITGPFWQDLSSRLLRLISAGRVTMNLEMLRKLQEASGQIERQHQSLQRILSTLTPWIALLEAPPALLLYPDYQEPYHRLRTALPYSPSVAEIAACVEHGQAALRDLRKALKDHPLPSAPSDLPDPHNAAPMDATATTLAPEMVETQASARSEALDWLDRLDRALRQASAGAALLADTYRQIADQADQYVEEMDFSFLYHAERRVFHIGYNLDSGQLDANDYDLMASESRITSLIAIARGQAPPNHWLHLGRPVTRVEGLHVLLSWSATMFEYLMPPLFTPTYPGTLLAESIRGAVLRQIAYGEEHHRPWGISESGFYRFDSNQNYQYRAFGVPGLGFKRGLGDDLVVAPYASLMAIGIAPQEVMRNLHNLNSLGMFGLHGYYEAIDFTTSRLPLGETSAIVREYMAHHQGMALHALANYFYDNIMVQRMMRDPRIQSIDLLLQEQTPKAAPLQNPNSGEVKGINRVVNAPIEISPWPVPVQTPIPQMHLLSNGHYLLTISNAGGGYSSWNQVDLTRWQPDAVLDPWGAWIYLQELPLEPAADAAPTDTWSACYRPIPAEAKDYQATFHAHMAVFRRRQNGITSTLEVTVSPDDPVEIRRLHLLNDSPQVRRLRATSYGEVILNARAADNRHPVFNKLFIESEWVQEMNLQIFRRRPRSNNEKPVYLAHMLVLPDTLPPTRAHEADRARFLGRGKSVLPTALTSPDYLSGSSGATLDPIYALGQEVVLQPHTHVHLAYLTFAAESREDILALAARYQGLARIERTFHQSDLAAQAWLGRQNLDSKALQHTLQILSALIYPFKELRSPSFVLSNNRLGQSGLWRFGISGDYPIIVVQVEEARQLDLVREVLYAHRYLRTRGFLADVVLLNLQQTNYGAELTGLLYRLNSRLASDQWLNQRGGIFVLYADQMRPEERTLLLTAARAVFYGAKGSLEDQLPGYSIQVQHLPDFSPTRLPTGATGPVPVTAALPAAAGTAVEIPAAAALDSPGERLFFNGWGGFSPDGREYIIDLPPGRNTPAPWSNVIGYPHFGFLVSESGSQCTWADNSGENRLTPWLNDPLRDLTGEALYLRDEETGEVWTPTPLPAGEETPFRVRHGAGYSIFEHVSHNLSQTLTLFASPNDPVKIVRLRLHNHAAVTRRITATQYVEWVLGLQHFASQPFLVPEYDSARGCLLVRNPYSADFGEKVAFLATSRAIHGVTADRMEFIGRSGSMSQPAAFRRLGLETRITPGEDTCGVLQVHLDLLPDQSEEIFFLIGQGDTAEQARTLVDRYHVFGEVDAVWQQVQEFWDQQLGAVQVQSPEPALDLLLNRWLLYQALSCRVWGRTAYYQSSGAFGFRDQLQDVLATLASDPAIARAQILDAAAHQFEAGDVLHWWHPPVGRGVRTHFADDLLWLPYVTAAYVEATGDESILSEKIPFRTAPPLKPGEEERYGEFPLTRESYTLFEHCRRALEKGATRGAHDLPLFGAGDWNDGMNRVGEKGQGESVWLGWFLCDVLERFAALSDRLQEQKSSNGHALPREQMAAWARQWRTQAHGYAEAIGRNAWDGAWYRRGYYDDGQPLGSNQSEECRIDAIAQSWALISGAGEPVQARRAMQSVLDHLVRPADRLLLLFTPPFDRSEQDPGYIKGYLPGTRENGGQYTHAAIWTAWAFTQLRDGAQAHHLFSLLNPILQSDAEAKAAAYRVEPYVIAADIYSAPPYVGRGGWTWYTGSAAWMYRLGWERLLGLRLEEGRFLRVDPLLPPHWDGFTAAYRFGKSRYSIRITRANGADPSARLDGAPLPEARIPLVDDGAEHQVEVQLPAASP
jgi:cyclic beta-1,2-glucan synthetase